MLRSVAFIVALFTACESIKAQGFAQETVPSWEKKTPVWGRVTRVEGMMAEFSLNQQSGLWNGDSVRIFRRIEAAKELVIPKNPRYEPRYVQTNAKTIELGTMAVRIVDDKQAVGKANGFPPVVGDYVLFQKPVPRIDDPDNQFNKLIGSYAEITLCNVGNSSDNSVLAPRRGLILDVKSVTKEDIRKLVVVFPSISADTRMSYTADDISRMRVGATDYVFDSTYNTLAETKIVASRGHSSKRPATLASKPAFPPNPYMVPSPRKRKSPSPASRGSSPAPNISPEARAILTGVAIIAAAKLLDQMFSGDSGDSAYAPQNYDQFNPKSNRYYPYATQEEFEMAKRRQFIRP